jgi:hypothetical protein
MTDETFRVQGGIDQWLFDRVCEAGSLRFGGELFELEDSGFGEPFIMRRASDGARFEVEVGADVRRLPAQVPGGVPA